MQAPVVPQPADKVDTPGTLGPATPSASSKDRGMQLMDQALLEAVQAKEVDPDAAYLHASDKKLLQRFVTDP